MMLASIMILSRLFRSGRARLAGEKGSKIRRRENGRAKMSPFSLHDGQDCFRKAVLYIMIDGWERSEGGDRRSEVVPRRAMPHRSNHDFEVLFFSEPKHSGTHRIWVPK